MKLLGIGDSLDGGVVIAILRSCVLVRKHETTHEYSHRKVERLVQVSASSSSTTQAVA